MKSPENNKRMKQTPMCLGRFGTFVTVVSCLTFLLPCRSNADVVFSDNFDSGASSDWGNERGNWRVVGGSYDAMDPENNPLTYSGVSSLPSLTDFIVDVDVNDLNDGGIWLRSSFNGGSINGILLVTGGFGGGNSGLYWHVVLNGSPQQVQNNVMQSGLQGSDVHLTIKVVDDTYSVFLNGNTIPFTTLTSNAFPSGSVGLYDFSPTSGASSPRGQTFDNFQVNDLTFVAPVPEPTSLISWAMVAIVALTAAVSVRRKRRRSRCPAPACGSEIAQIAPDAK